jgi:hypothetical protein
MASDAQNKNCRPKNVMQVHILQHFHLKQFITLKYCLKLNFKIVEELCDFCF